MNIVAEDILMHYGMPKRSGRYPWGSGDNPYQHSGDFISRVEELRKSGLSEKEVAEAVGLNTSQLRTQLSLAKNERRALEVETAKGLREKGYSLNEIAEKMGYNSDSSIRSLLNSDSEAKMNQAQKTAEILKEAVEKKGMIDVSAGVERELGISKEKLRDALYILQMEGYEVYGGGIPEVTNPGKQINTNVLCPPGTEHKEIYNFANVHSLMDYTSHDGGETFDTLQYPKSMDSSRLKIRYAEEGGLAKDGVIELRRGVDDLSLGDSHYAQVRILVDDKKYLKGMAIYSDDLPDGVDVVFNTNKKAGTPMGDVLKNIKDDPDNPFGSLLKANGQSYYTDENGNKQLSLINKTREEGDWEKWSDSLPSQFLSKQSMALINKQLKLAESDKRAEYDEICSLTNPTVRKALLQSFADDCDSSAVHLQAAALPRQNYKVILPLTSVKDNEVYAPTYENGEQVALIRYPHGGTFEIPILTVNNKQGEGKKVLGNAKDAIGISSNVAERLSGADFDGDTVMVIPTGGKIKITSHAPLEAMKDSKGRTFDPKDSYGADHKEIDADGKTHYYRNGKEYKPLPKSMVQKEMGSISNLITDMTIKGADFENEISKAVKHSMVVIDAEKHKLDYKQSEIDNDIASLKKKYQSHLVDGEEKGGAATLISRAKSEVSIPKTRGSGIIDPETGEVSYKLSGETYVDKKGNVKTRMQKSTQMAETKDARTLSSGTPQEEAYADYANAMKSLANQARKEMVSTGKIPYSPSAKETYAEEVKSLDSKLRISQMNAPKEREAQRIANTMVSAKKQDNPDMTKAEIKKENQRALTAARTQVGAHRTQIDITDKEWEAIQSGAISENKLWQIINHTDTDELRKRAMPRATSTLSEAKKNKIAAMNASGYTIGEIAKALGVSASTVSNYL